MFSKIVIFYIAYQSKTNFLSLTSDFEKLSTETVGEHFKDKDVLFCTLGTTRRAAGSAVSLLGYNLKSRGWNIPLTEFQVCTVSYKTSFSTHSDVWPMHEVRRPLLPAEMEEREILFLTTLCSSAILLFFILFRTFYYNSILIWIHFMLSLLTCLSGSFTDTATGYTKTFIDGNSCCPNTRRLCTLQWTVSFCHETGMETRCGHENYHLLLKNISG